LLTARSGIGGVSLFRYIPIETVIAAIGPPDAGCAPSDPGAMDWPGGKAVQLNAGIG
jgi:hypothetical protein